MARSKRIKDLDPKIRVFRSHWREPQSMEWYNTFKDEARQALHGRLVHATSTATSSSPSGTSTPMRSEARDHVGRPVLDRLHQLLRRTTRCSIPSPESVALGLRKKMILTGIAQTSSSGATASNVRVHGQDPWRGQSDRTSSAATTSATSGMRRGCGRSGATRTPVYRAGRFKLPIPGFLFDLFPHRWDDPQFFDDLEVYEGPYIKAVLENPREFVRDGLKTYEAVVQRSAAGSVR